MIPHIVIKLGTEGTFAEDGVTVKGVVSIKGIPAFVKNGRPQYGLLGGIQETGLLLQTDGQHCYPIYPGIRDFPLDAALVGPCNPSK